MLETMWMEIKGKGNRSQIVVGVRYKLQDQMGSLMGSCLGPHNWPRGIINGGRRYVQGVAVAPTSLLRVPISCMRSTGINSWLAL